MMKKSIPEIQIELADLYREMAETPRWKVWKQFSVFRKVTALEKEVKENEL